MVIAIASSCMQSPSGSGPHSAAVQHELLGEGRLLALPGRRGAEAEGDEVTGEVWK